MSTDLGNNKMNFIQQRLTVIVGGTSGMGFETIKPLASAFV